VFRRLLALPVRTRGPHLRKKIWPSVLWSRLTCALVTAFLIPISTPLHGDSVHQFHLRFGFRGSVAPDTCPLTLVFPGSEGSVEGLLEYHPGLGTPSAGTTCWINAAPGARKIYRLVVPSPSGRRTSIRLGGERVDIGLIPSPTHSGPISFLIVGESRISYRDYVQKPGSEAGGAGTGQPGAVCYSHPIELPESFHGYADVERILIKTLPQGGVSPLQIDAIRDWVMSGGSLIFSMGLRSNHLADLPSLDSLCPVAFTGPGQPLSLSLVAEKLGVPGLDPGTESSKLIPMNDGMRRPGSRSRSGGLVTSWSLGAGQIHAFHVEEADLAIDPALTKALFDAARRDPIEIDSRDWIHGKDRRWIREGLLSDLDGNHRVVFYFLVFHLAGLFFVPWITSVGSIGRRMGIRIGSTIVLAVMALILAVQGRTAAVTRALTVTTIPRHASAGTAAGWLAVVTEHSEDFELELASRRFRPDLGLRAADLSFTNLGGLMNFDQSGPWKINVTHRSDRLPSLIPILGLTVLEGPLDIVCQEDGQSLHVTGVNHTGRLLDDVWIHGRKIFKVGAIPTGAFDLRSSPEWAGDSLAPGSQNLIESIVMEMVTNTVETSRSSDVFLIGRTRLLDPILAAPADLQGDALLRFRVAPILDRPARIPPG